MVQQTGSCYCVTGLVVQQIWFCCCVTGLGDTADKVVLPDRVRQRTVSRHVLQDWVMQHTGCVTGLGNAAYRLCYRTG